MCVCVCVCVCACVCVSVCVEGESILCPTFEYILDKSRYLSSYCFICLI